MDDRLAPQGMDPLARRTERILVGVRLVTGMWGIFMVLSRPDYPSAYQALVQATSITALTVFLMASLGLWLAIELVPRHFTVTRAAGLGLGLDLAIATGITFAFGFDRTTAVWIILFLLPVEGAMRFQLAGAAWSFGITVLGYVGREVAWSRWLDEPADPLSAVFRLTVVGVVAVLVGSISEQLRSEREVAQAARERAERSDRWRSRLVSALGHDVRSPLATIEMQAQAIIDMDLGPDDRREMLAGIIRQARRLSRLGDGLLDLAQADEARLVLHPRTTSVRDLVEDAVDCLNVQVEVDVADGLRVDADPDRLQQVLLNLIGNARKYGEGPIEVTAFSDDAEVVIAVRDHGQGIPVQLRERLFVAFETGGTLDAIGLGLWLVDAIVLAHAGSVELEDAEPGARFVVRLPQGRLAGEDEPAAGSLDRPAQSVR